MQKNIQNEALNNMIENIVVKKLEQSQIEIIGSIKASFFESFKLKAIENINNEINIPGFRKGKVPETILISKVGEMTILEEMAELALSQVYPEIIRSEKIDAVGRPEINITKLALNNPLEFKIITTVMPEIKLANYKKIAENAVKEKEDVHTVSEKEIEDAILKIRKSKVNHDNHDHEKMTDKEHELEIEKNLPELNDEFVMSIGDFKNVNDFKEKVKLSLIEEKKYQAREKKRILISDQLIQESQFDIPKILIDSELRRVEFQFLDDIKRMNVKLDDYLKHAKKTMEEIRKEWMPYAEKKAKLQLILNRISENENITVDKSEVENEVKHILDHYKDADPEQAFTYAETVLTNDKVYRLFELKN
ncbi:MAG: trigger factor [Patescibacteria group bacterium]